VLTAALWAFSIQRPGDSINCLSPLAISRLQAATTWLLALLDPDSGQVPNLGPNDGANIFPLSILPFADYRPVLLAASRAFLGVPALPPGTWDDLSMWLGLPALSTAGTDAHLSATLSHPQHTVLRGSFGSWAYLRTARFTSRPGHADQLHLDLWWRGHNITIDPGTYRYTAPPPWDNSLSSAMVHNTLTIDGQEPMTRAGRFLFLDWAQAEIVERVTEPDRGMVSLTARQDGYRRLGITHQRRVNASPDGAWQVIDTLTGPSASQHDIRLHWLVPDWQWEFDPHGAGLKLTAPVGKIYLRVYQGSNINGSPDQPPLKYTLVRAGELIYGSGPVHPTWGWTSPTYGEKIPALAVIITLQSELPVVITSLWSLVKMRRPKPRASVVLIKDDKIALIERWKAGRHYFVFPGGGIEPGETPAQAAVREAEEELGVRVTVGRMIAEAKFHGMPQYYLLAELQGGEFGSGTGKEMDSPADSERGAYRPGWQDISSLDQLPVMPGIVGRYIQEHYQAGWPEHPLYVPELPME
jgi:8-oxo-dGTP pyrophosphatase MutT (NUDIX family)